VRRSCRLRFLFVLASSAVACRREHATAQTCGAILGRVVELELTEQGFRDPVLAAQKKPAIRALLDPELRKCIGRKVRHKARACIEKARTTEEISHVCLH
jgi:hypothetical protein